LRPLLADSLIDVAPPLQGTITAIRTNGVIRLTFEHAAGRGVVPEEFVKFPEDVAEELRRNQTAVLMLADKLRGPAEDVTTTHRAFRDKIFEMGVSLTTNSSAAARSTTECEILVSMTFGSISTSGLSTCRGS
jgi:hypothetical protein